MLILSVLNAQPITEQDQHYHHHDQPQKQVATPKKIKLKKQLRLLDLMDQNISKLIKKQREFQKKITSQEKKIQQLEEQLSTLAQSMKVKRESLSRALILRKKLQSARIAEILLNANGPVALKRREVYLHSIFKADTQKLRALHQEQRQMKSHYKELQTLQISIKSLYQDLDLKNQELTQRRHDEWQLLSQVYGVKPLQSQSKNRMIQLRMPPAKGKWIDQFHKFRGIKRAKLWGAGIWIKNNENTPIYSVEKGRVIFSQKLKGWNYVVIIEHENQMTSIYAGMEQSLVKVGQKVAIQEFIGSVGEMNTQSRLYFELRKAGIAIHPQRWIEEKK